MLPFSKLKKLADPEIRRKNVVELQRALSGLRFDVMTPAMGDPVFVIGCSRSGTTVTYETIAASRELKSIGYEVPQLWNSLSGPHTNGWESEAAAAAQARPEHRQAALRFYFQRVGSGRVVDKTCINTLRVPYLLSLFPRAHFVFIQRDGRDNVSSLIDGWRENGHFGLQQFLGPSPTEVSINDGEFHEWNFFLPPGWRSYNRERLEVVCAYQWITANRLALDGRDRVPPAQWTQIRYEDIFERPVEMFGEVFARLGLRFDADLRRRCETLGERPTSIVKGPPKREKWRARNPELIELVLERIAPMQRELGYPTT